MGVGSGISILPVMMPQSLIRPMFNFAQGTGRHRVSVTPHVECVKLRVYENSAAGDYVEMEISAQPGDQPPQVQYHRFLADTSSPRAESIVRRKSVASRT